MLGHMVLYHIAMRDFQFIADDNAIRSSEHFLSLFRLQFAVRGDVEIRRNQYQRGHDRRGNHQRRNRFGHRRYGKPADVCPIGLKHPHAAYVFSGIARALPATLCRATASMRSRSGGSNVPLSNRSTISTPSTAPARPKVLGGWSVDSWNPGFRARSGKDGFLVQRVSSSSTASSGFDLRRPGRAGVVSAKAVR